MKIGIESELKYLQSRTGTTNFNFIEMVPQNRQNTNSYQPINIINAKITAQVSRLIIAYEWYNIEELMLGWLDSDENNYFKVQSQMPALGRQVNLTISWAFQD
jgi:pyoverdine/dityrosine biosynthesis protein Dit1